MRPRTRVLLSGVATAVVVTALPGHASAHYEVRPGDTASEIAIRHGVTVRHLVRLNHLRHGGDDIYVGQRLRIVRRAGHHPRGEHRKRDDGPRKLMGFRSRRMLHHWRHNPTQRTVREMVSGQARDRGMDRHLALAIAWQESGWQQDVRSSAGAIGVMQVLPSTGRWLSGMAGRRLHIRHSHDNVQAGLMFIRWLHRETRRPRNAVAGYYQGLGSVRRDGIHRDTRRYVRNVRALQRRFERGRLPY